MGFKTVNSYNSDRFGGLFLLRNDGDSADVVFLYRNVEDVLVADTHYIKSSEYSGYVHCCGTGCPACAKNIRVQTKLFVPILNLGTNQIEFWDRTMHFEPQLMQDVFKNYPNPVDYVFRITRKGQAGDVNTTYEIRALGKNTTYTYDQILANAGVKMPDHYETICKDASISDLSNMLSASSPSNVAPGSMPSYQVTPRGVAPANPATVDEVPGVALDDSFVGFDDAVSADSPATVDDDVNF